MRLPIVISNLHPISYRFGVIAQLIIQGLDTVSSVFEPRTLSGLRVPTMFNLGSLESANGLVLIELYSLGVTSEALRAKTDRKSAISLQRSHFDPKFQVEGVAPTNHFCTVNWPMNVLQLCR